MKTKSIFLIFTILAVLVSCKEKIKKLNAPQKVKTIPSKTTSTNNTVYLDKNGVSVVTDDGLITIPAAGKFKNQVPYAGIYLISVREIVKKYRLLTKSYLYFSTTDTSNGRNSFIYVFNLKTKKFINDREFNHDFLVSTGGKFIIDQNGNNLFNIDIGWYEKRNSPIVFAGMYRIKTNDFKFITAVYEKNNNIINDNSGDDDENIIKFYNTSLRNNARHGKLLPNDWFKIKETKGKITPSKAQ